jgi:hypothetical protein
MITHTPTGTSFIRILMESRIDVALKPTKHRLFPPSIILLLCTCCCTLLELLNHDPIIPKFKSFEA